MTALDELFARTRAEDRAALVGYLPAGFPTKHQSIAAIEAMVAGGVDLVEVGLPYSDPVMDGPASRLRPNGHLPPGPGSVTSSTSSRRPQQPAPPWS